MAIIFAESFDWTKNEVGIGLAAGRAYTVAIPGSVGVDRVAGRVSGYAARIRSSINIALPTYYIQRSLDVALVSGMFSFSFFADQLSLGPDSGHFFQLLNGATVQLGVTINAAGAIIIQRGTTTLGTTPTTPILPSTWHRIEIAFTIHDTTGAYEIRVDGVNVLSATNVDTRNGTPTDVNMFRLLSGGINPGPIYYTYDDIVVTDPSGSKNTGFLGDLHIEQLRPSADVMANWTPSTGSDNHAMVDDTALDTSDYITAAAAAEDRYELSDLAANPDSIFGVQALYFGGKDDAGTCTMRSRVISGSDIADGTTVGATTSGTQIADIYEVDPQGGGDWTGARVNAAQLGIERVS